MAKSGNLHTFQDNHAIKEAVISFTVTPQIVNPVKYADLLSEGRPFYGVYHKFEPIKFREIRVNTGLNAQTMESIKEAGFKFIAFKDGKTSEVIQGLSQARQSLVTFNTVNYQGWSTFVGNSLKAAVEIANFQPVYMANAFSLMFIDEFYFEDEKEYKPAQLFNLNSRNLPKGIEDSDFVDFNFNLKRHRDNKYYFENVFIKVFNEGTKKIIRITENLTFEIAAIAFTEILKDPDLRACLDYSHDENKNILKDILNSEITKIINL